MKKLFMIGMLALVAVSGWAQEQFQGMFQCEALKASMVINLAEKKIPLKDFDGEDTYGYVKGELNGTWVILKVKEVKDKKAVVRMVSDIGYDAQDVELEKGKYVKMPKVSVFKKE